MKALTIRTEPLSGDAGRVRKLVEATGFFRPDEADVAEELVLERLGKGLASGYHFLFVDASNEDRLDGYACYGPAPCTVGTFDLYWIAVHPEAQGRGLGRELFEAVAAAALEQGGRILIAETSSRPQYAPTRRFYDRCGCEVGAIVREFYDVDDDKVIYTRKLARP
ncbi:N-acetyltransferase [Oceanidesulfovibrio indonesiensis]|uniref:N-acetyltransferase n=1 Tax=Oceanidesulfovibrio indonesiensis TaxID=54767 RepID=A0A7M3MGC3_9BACT|nr:GNAT family N-acetyltransferase [Oceanidesulfovibrio indonesiensis]TVM17907.1 N-acetyltransferase [Oceanidesulfovibrio indonesiensis]